MLKAMSYVFESAWHVLRILRVLRATAHEWDRVIEATKIGADTMDISIMNSDMYKLPQ